MINRTESALIARERRNQASRPRKNAEEPKPAAPKSPRTAPRTTH